MAQAFSGTRYGLTTADVDTYRLLFAAVDRADWDAVAATINRLHDRRLVGHVLSAEYLAPGFQAPFADLRSWLDLYADLPEADDIYRLALNRLTLDTSSHGAAGLPLPRGAVAYDESPTDPDLTGALEPYTGAGERAAAKFFAADDKGALADASKAAAMLGDKASRSLLIGGLAAWRLGELSEASHNFHALMASRNASAWMLAAGAFWAARVEERNGATEAAAKLFAKASSYPLTFYGMLAMRKLGLNIPQEISPAQLSPAHLDVLAQTPSGYRGIALLQIGRQELAARELERIQSAGDPRTESALILVAQAGRLGNLSPILARKIAAPANTASAHFPIPAWIPRGGFRIDPALVYAVARQESRFDPTVVSPMGAAGLMQIMPGTAELMAPNRVQSLFDPATNLDLGQRYLRSLMQNPNIGENLLLLAAAYNAGWSRLAEFQRILDNADPLLAIESMPVDQTRTFVQRVLTNYWVYRARLGVDTSSLTDLAEGHWPRYRWNGASQSAVSTTQD